MGREALGCSVALGVEDGGARCRCERVHEEFARDIATKRPVRGGSCVCSEVAPASAGPETEPTSSQNSSLELFLCLSLPGYSSICAETRHLSMRLVCRTGCIALHSGVKSVLLVTSRSSPTQPDVTVAATQGGDEQARRGREHAEGVALVGSRLATYRRAVSVSRGGRTLQPFAPHGVDELVSMAEALASTRAPFPRDAIGLGVAGDLLGSLVG